MTKSPVVVTECELPLQSLLRASFVREAYFQDSYRVHLTRSHATVADIFLAVFAHHPTWMKATLIVRNRIASLFGLQSPPMSEILSPEIKASYDVGDKIGPGPIFALSESELIAGRDNKHLDFRLSIIRGTQGHTSVATVSTVCVVHNIFGKIYLFFIVPFHRWGVRWLLSAACAAERL